MKCKYCGAELPEGTTLCPECGAEDAVKEKLSAGQITILAVLVIVAIGVMAALVFGGLNIGQNDATVPSTAPSVAPTVGGTIPPDGNPDDVTCKGSYTVTDEELMNQLSNVVATVGDGELTNTDLQIYYWMQFYDFMEMYGSYAYYFGLDIYAPLDTQVSLDGANTWQQYFLSSALSTWHSYEALCQEAKAQGYELPAEFRDELDALPSTLNTSAVASGYADAEKMIQADMGPGSTLESYIAFMEAYYLSNLFYSDYVESLTFTEEEIAAYFEEHSAEYAEKGLDKTTHFVDVRHILIKPKGGTTDANGVTTYSEEEWEICRQSAQAILDAYLAGELTEERFAELANTYSEDTGSNTNGGLYNDVYVGQMVEPFENWCFDENRTEGETGLVQTSYGYHIMYYVRYSEAWYDTASADLLQEKAEEFIQGVMEKYPLVVDYSAIALGLVDFSALN